MNILKKKSVQIFAMLCIALMVCALLSDCSPTDTGGGGTGIGGDQVLPLNLSIFVDLSDRIEKQKDNMTQSDKDQVIINGLADSFIDKQVRTGFNKSTDSFQIIFYPAPEGAQLYADSLCLNMGAIKGPQKKRALLSFQGTHKNNIKNLYDGALKAETYFGSDIWGFFAKNKVDDLFKKGYRNVLIILSDGYIYDENNKIQEGNNYSYLLPKTLSVKDSALIPCKISNSDIELYFIECNANPQTDYPKMREILEKWFKEMGIKKVDIQDTDIPANTLKHLNNQIFSN